MSEKRRAPFGKLTKSALGHKYSTGFPGGGGEWLAKLESRGELIDLFDFWRQTAVESCFSVKDYLKTKNWGSPFKLDPGFRDATRILAMWCDIRLRIDPTAFVDLLDQLSMNFPTFALGPGYTAGVLTPDSEYADIYKAFGRALAVWDRAFYASLAVVEPAENSDNEPRQRECYQRDHLWLKWEEKDGLTPAPIRDRWDALTEQQRWDFAPTSPDRVGDVSKGHGADTVKKALKKAKREKNNGDR